MVGLLAEKYPSISPYDNSIELVGYELNHAYQYENGEVALVVGNSGYGQLYDITDETKAYNRERALVRC